VTDFARVEAGVRYLERNGFRVKVGTHAGSVHGYLAGSDRERAEDLHAMAADPEVRAILCLRGGYGTTRLLPLLDFELFLRDPKVIAGFSDITALQLALWQRCRLVTFHGPMVAVDFGGAVDPATEQSFWDMVTGSDRPGAVELGNQGTLRVLRGGRAGGTLLGGNLSLLAAMVGTPYLPDFSGAIVFLEEIGEEPYRVDRMLTQLGQAGLFSGISAVAAGQFSDCVPRDPGRPSLSLEDLLAALCRSCAVPFVAGCRFGHVSPKLTIPLGLRGELDAESGHLTLSGPAVV
jgi:muramoyltetrapeptide carboxypeptidase